MLYPNIDHIDAQRNGFDVENDDDERQAIFLLAVYALSKLVPYPRSQDSESSLGQLYHADVVIAPDTSMLMAVLK